jgi:hypothetical protein
LLKRLDLSFPRASELKADPYPPRRATLELKELGQRAVVGRRATRFGRGNQVGRAPCNRYDALRTFDFRVPRVAAATTGQAEFLAVADGQGEATHSR